MGKSKYWDIKPILNIKAQYRIIFGERSNGKTYGTLLHMMEDYIKYKKQFAYIRRWLLDIKAGKMQQVFDSIVRNGEVTKLTNGQWNGIKYRSGKFYLIATNGDDTVEDETPMGFVFAIGAMEHDKSISFPGVENILFEEFISRNGYLDNEFTLFMNVLSTIIRDRDNVDIWMLGNTVSKECPYFKEMGLRHVFQQKQGTIDTYTYTKQGMENIIAVEYTKNLASKKSDKYFIFDNPRLEMITGGAWEMAFYPHLFEKYKPNQIAFIFFISYRDVILQCEIIEGKETIFIFIHEKTTPLKYREDDLIYQQEPCSSPNIRMDITRCKYLIEKKILDLITQERVCFQDNEIGEVFNDYLKWCKQHSVIKS